MPLQAVVPPLERDSAHGKVALPKSTEGSSAPILSSFEASGLTKFLNGRGPVKPLITGLIAVFEIVVLIALNREPLVIHWDNQMPPYAKSFCEALAEYMREVLPITQPSVGKWAAARKQVAVPRASQAHRPRLKRLLEGKGR